MTIIRDTVSGMKDRNSQEASYRNHNPATPRVKNAHSLIQVKVYAPKQAHHSSSSVPVIPSTPGQKHKPILHTLRTTPKPSIRPPDLPPLRVLRHFQNLLQPINHLSRGKRHRVLRFIIGEGDGEIRAVANRRAHDRLRGYASPNQAGLRLEEEYGLGDVVFLSSSTTVGGAVSPYPPLNELFVGPHEPVDHPFPRNSRSLPRTLWLRLGGWVDSGIRCGSGARHVLYDVSEDLQIVKEEV